MEVTTENMIASLKQEVIPTLFAENTRLSEYGGSERGAMPIQEISNIMEGGAVSALTNRIRQIVSCLSDADPRKIAKAPGWLDKLLGREVERQVRYQIARKSLDELLDDASGIAQSVRDTLRALDKMVLTHASEAELLDAHIRAGREFLDENPDVGVATTGVMEFDKPRERFARKLANLAALLSSHQMSVMQMKLTRANAVNILDRFSETVTVLVPIWRQHTLALITTQNMSSAMVQEATKAHTALIRSLSMSLEGINP